MHSRQSDSLSKAHVGQDVVYAPLKKTDVALAQAAIFQPENGGLLCLTDNDVFFELGCGHGEVLLAARSAAPGCRCIGVELDAEIAAEARRNVAEFEAKATGRPIQVVQGSLDDCLRSPPGEGDDAEMPSLAEATVVYLYVGQWANLKLRPTLLQVLRPETRIVTRSFTMGDSWSPDAVAERGGEIFYLYTVTTERKADPALQSTSDLESRYGLHWVQPPPTAFNPIPTA